MSRQPSDTCSAETSPPKSNRIWRTSLAVSPRQLLARSTVRFRRAPFPGKQRSIQSGTSPSIWPECEKQDKFKAYLPLTKSSSAAVGAVGHSPLYQHLAGSNPFGCEKQDKLTFKSYNTAVGHLPYYPQLVASGFESRRMLGFSSFFSSTVH